MKPYRLLSLAAALILGVVGLAAQNNTISPYSRFGYGILHDYANAAQRGMGGVGYAQNSGRQINPMNPASYAAIDTLTFLFDMGASAKTLWTEENGLKGKRFTGGLDYITMQFPLGRYMGGSIGLLPYSSVGYKFGEEVVNGEESHQGSGTLNEVYLGVSGRPFKGFTVGANVSYLFGTLLNDTYITAENSSTALFERVLEIRDYNLRFGAQYSFEIGSRNRVTLGAVYSPGQSFHGHAYGVYYDLSSDVKADTIGYTSMRHDYTRPATFGGGVAYEWNKSLTVEADFTYQPWKDVKYKAIEGFESPRFDNRWKAALGLQWVPNSRGSYFRRVNYRIGGYYNHDYVMVGDNNINDFGLSIGLGMPAPVNRLTKTVVNLGFEWHHRTTSPVALVKENFFQITIGINFNELWFWQNKIQ